jgi:DUF4097 and DUF4098 domain-containing protein YvlB
LLAALMLGGGQTEQTLPVKKGMRLEVHTYTGDVDVKTWDRDEVKVEAEHSVRESVDVRATEAALIVRGRSRTGPARSIDYAITIPTWMAVRVEGQGADVVLTGVGGDVSVETNRGDIIVRGGSGFVSVKSVMGQITIERARGRIEAQTVNDSIRIADVTGDISVGTTNGGIDLDRVDTANLDAYTVNGGIAFDGPIKDRGIYRITTHNGLVSLAVPERVNATLSVRTYGGNFRSSFPVKVDNTERRNRFTATLGDGSARVELETFNGSILLRRPGEPRPQSDRDRDRQRSRVRVAPVPVPAPNPVPVPVPAPPAPPQ